MNSVKEIIDLYGGMETLQRLAIWVEVDGFMPLSIEYSGVGLRGGSLISIAHYYQQNGDMMADPDLVVEIIGDEWHPVAYQQDNIGLYEEAVYQEGEKVLLRPQLIEDLQSFMALWNSNLRQQGFVDAAGRQCQRDDT
jgi:hypothetical protein